MHEVATITFRDVESSDEAVAIIRCEEGRVALCLSLRSNGDVEITINKADMGRLIDALRQGMDRA